MFRRKKKPPPPGRPSNFELMSDRGPRRVLERAGQRLIFQREQMSHLLPWGKMAVTFIIILFVGLGSAFIHAQLTRVQREINATQRQIRAQQQENDATRSMLDERYTSAEIEHIAINYLGMTLPDASQIIHINVPRRGAVLLNHDEHIEEPTNHFWEAIRGFFTGISSSIFGGE
jgi:cell division protein FtsL